MSRALLFAGMILAACVAGAHAGGAVSNAGYTAPSFAFQNDDGNKIYVSCALATPSEVATTQF